LQIAGRLWARRVATVTTQTRSVTLVPKAGSKEAMQAEAIEQLRARVKYQKELTAVKAHPYEAELSEMWRWMHASLMIGVPVCLLSGLYSFTMDEHPHRVEHVPEYLHVRSKEYPWECSDCDLFDRKCWKKCKEEMKNEEN
jgi:hypothetical protein